LDDKSLVRLYSGLAIIRPNLLFNPATIEMVAPFVSQRVIGDWRRGTCATVAADISFRGVAGSASLVAKRDHVPHIQLTSQPGS
jgi:hypothetical protein